MWALFNPILPSLASLVSTKYKHTQICCGQLMREGGREEEGGLCFSSEFLHLTFACPKPFCEQLVLSRTIIIISSLLFQWKRIARITQSRKEGPPNLLQKMCKFWANLCMSLSSWSWRQNLRVLPFAIRRKFSSGWQQWLTRPPTSVHTYDDGTSR